MLAEALTLSGLSTPLALQPRKAGLPVSFQSDLSVASSPVRGCPRSGFATIGLLQAEGQADGLSSFRDLGEIFADDFQACDRARIHPIGRDRQTRGIGSARFDQGGNLGSQELDCPQDLLVGKCADADVKHEALDSQHLLDVQDLSGDRLDVTHDE